jgi:CRP/FNR family transcriptional regulator
MYPSFLEHLRKFITLSDEEENILLSHLSYKAVKKKEQIGQAGKTYAANYFILKGCLRLYALKDDGTEQTIQFGIDNWWISDYMSLESGKPGAFSLQAVEASELLLLHRNTEEELFRQLPQLERYFRIILQKAYAASQLRIQYIFCFNGKERYQHFSTSFPGFVQRVPQYMLASYLGFSTEFLSKIRANKV